jgi:hypothetical protein
MAYDCRGVAVTTGNPASLIAFERAVTSLLLHRADLADHLAAALAADPELVAAHCLSGFSYLLLGRSELKPLARCTFETARTALARRGGTRRERALTEALAAWCDGAMDQSAAILESALAAEPRDALTAKLVQSLRFMLGDGAGMRRSIEAALTGWSADMPGYGAMLGCHAFALEETGALAAAERVGREALGIEAFDVWGCHAVAHVYETRGEPARGLAWTMLHEPRWRDVNNFARHMFWHRALFHLARNEADIALGLYDSKIRAVRTDDYRDVANGASLLLRLEARGIPTGARWRELADIAERHVQDHALAFAQLHYLLCLIGDGRLEAAYRLFAALDAEARCGHGTQAEILGAVGVDLAKLMLEGSARGDMLSAAHVQKLRAAIPRLGGSRAQRQIFDWILDAATRPEREAA